MNTGQYIIEIKEQLVQVNNKLEQIIAVLHVHQKKLEEHDRRFDAIESKLIEHDERFEQIDRRFEAIDERFEQVDSRFDAIDERFEQVDSRFDSVDIKLSEHDKILLDLEHTTKLNSDKLDFAINIGKQNNMLISQILNQQNGFQKRLDEINIQETQIIKKYHNRAVLTSVTLSSAISTAISIAL